MKSYKTISVKYFWEMLYDPQKFLDAQEISLLEGGKIDRIYLVDSNNLQNESKEEILALRRNYEQHVKYKNYCFSILFSTADSEINRRENFSIWSDNSLQYKVLFSIKYGLNTYAVTNMVFANYASQKSSAMKENRGKVDAFESFFNFSKKRVSEQNKHLLLYLNRNTTGGTPTSQLNQQLDFLRRIGVVDIEGFLAEKII